MQFLSCPVLKQIMKQRFPQELKGIKTNFKKFIWRFLRWLSDNWSACSSRDHTHTFNPTANKTTLQFEVTDTINRTYGNIFSFYSLNFSRSYSSMSNIWNTVNEVLFCRLMLMCLHKSSLFNHVWQIWHKTLLFLSNIWMIKGQQEKCT